MTRSTHARPSTTGRRLAAGALSVPMALTMAGTAAATEPVAAASVTSDAAVSASATDDLLAHDALKAEPAELPAEAVKGQEARSEKAEAVVEQAPADEDEAVVPAAAKPKSDERPATSNSAAVVMLDVDCTAGGATVTVESDKDISNVKVYYADGSMVERSMSGKAYTEFFAGDVVKVTAKSGTTTAVEDGLSCSPGDGDPAPQEPSTPAPGTPINGGGAGSGGSDGGSNGGSSSEADLHVVVQCVEDSVTVVVGSDKDISNVKVYYADGSLDEIEDLEGYAFEESFPGDVVKVTAKSGTTEVVVLADAFAACEVPGSEVPGSETPGGETPGNGTPGGSIGGGGGGAGTGNPPAVTPPVVNTPVVNTPVVNTPVVRTPAVSTTPVVGQPAPAAAVGVVSNRAPKAFTPTRSTGAGSTASPAALPFTGSTTSLLLALGAGLVVAGGGLALSGRRESTVTSV